MSIDNNPKPEDGGEEAQNESESKLEDEDVSMEVDPPDTQTSLFSTQQETDPVAIFQVDTEPLLESQEQPSSLPHQPPLGVPHIVPSTPTRGALSQDQASQVSTQEEICSNEQCRMKNTPCRRISFSPPTTEPSQDEFNTSWNLVLSESTTTQNLSRDDSDIVPASQETAPPMTRSGDSGIESRHGRPVSSGSDDGGTPLVPQSPPLAVSNSDDFSFIKSIPDSHVNSSLQHPASTPLSSQASSIMRPMKSLGSRKTPVISQTPEYFSFSEGDSTLPESMDIATSEKQFRLPLLPKRGQTSTPTSVKDQSVQVDMETCPHCHCFSPRPFLQALDGVVYDPKKTYSITYVTKVITKQLVIGGEVIKSYTSKHREDGVVEEVTVPVESYCLESPAARSTGYMTDISSSLSSNCSQEPSKKKPKLMSPRPNSPEFPLVVHPQPPAVPPKSPERSPSPEIQMATDAVPNPTGLTIMPGMRVMAKWKDGFYYPGVITSEDSISRWMIQFDDGDLHSIWSRDIILVDPLPEGQSVLTEAADHYFDPGIVRGYFRDHGQLGYIVESDSGDTRRYSRTAVILSGDQSTSLRKPAAPAEDSTISATISLDNMVEGRRRTRKPIATPSPTIAAGSRRSRIRPRPDPLLEASDASSSTSSGSGPSGSLQRTPKTPVKRVTTASSAQKKGTSTSTMGPLPPKNTFKGYAFLLSYAEKQPNSSGDFSDSTLSDDSRLYIETVDVPYNKNYLRKQILHGEGVVLDNFEQTQTTTCKHIYLLTVSHLRTIKYIQCLAAGIPCLSHTWVKASCEQGVALDSALYLQPAGFSLVTGTLIEWHGKRNMLQNMHILLTSNSNPEFVDMWAPVLLSAGADVVRKYPPASPGKGKAKVFSVDVVVTDPSCPEFILQRCQIQNTPLVSTEWVVHCLIHGARLSYTDHPKFHHTVIPS